MTTAELLYREAGSFERALAAAFTDTLPVPIRQILDPATAPLGFLPFLAAHESVDLWFDDWPEDRKRRMVAAARDGIAGLVGTRDAFKAFLPYVDAAIVARMAYPRRFVVGRAVLGQTPIGHKPFTTHLLLTVPLRRPARSFIVGRSAVARGALRTLDREPIRRVRRALTVAKAPDTLVSVNFGHRQPITLDDGFPLDGSYRFGVFHDRKRL